MRGCFAIALVFALLAAGQTAYAQTEPALVARRAAGQIAAASLALRDAETAQDRVAALTQTIQAFEEGLVAMREGLRRASIREQVIARDFEKKNTEVSRLLGVMLSMQTSASPVILLHPTGPLGTARSGMILADVTPAVQAEAAALRNRLEEVTLLRELQQNAAATLETGLRGIQNARTKLSQAVSDRTDLPVSFVEDPVKTAILLESSETLEGFASGLAEIADEDARAVLPDFRSAKGTLPLPVTGTLLRRFQEADAAGIKRPGIVMATQPLALVTTPWPATIRYRGPLLDYGNVMILEPSGDYLIILAGLNRVYGDVGQVLPAGAPVGLMGGADPAVGAFLTTAAEGGGADRTETLYMEVREGQLPVDPAKWFALNKE